MGLVGGGTVRNQSVDPKACFARALMLDPTYVKAWFDLGVVLGEARVEEARVAVFSWRVGGTERRCRFVVDSKTCFMKALELFDPEHAPNFVALERAWFDREFREELEQRMQESETRGVLKHVGECLHIIVSLQRQIYMADTV